MVGIWVESSGGASTFAKRWALPGKPYVSGYEATVLSGTAQLHIGCGQKAGGGWASNQHTPKFALATSRVLSARCNGAAGTFDKVTCSFPPKPNVGETPMSNWPAGQCTRFAAQQWKSAVGRHVSWTGNANRWNENAEAHGWRVTSAPAPRAVVVWEAGTTGGTNYGGAGHVAWVKKVSYKSDGWYLTAAEQNFPSGAGPSVRVVKHVNGMNYIHAPG